MINTGCETINRQQVLDAIAEQSESLKEQPDVTLAEHLLDLTKLFEDAESATGHRATDWLLVRDDYFEDFAQYEAGEGMPLIGWPYDHIDWAKAADALKQDYKQVSFSDETYWVRA